MKKICYLGERLNASGGSEAATPARTRFGWQSLENVGGYFI